MKAIAKQIGNSKKERIEVDGHVHLKSVNIGRWNYVVLFRYYNAITESWSDWYEGHSATREAAEKWQPFPMTTEMRLYKYPPSRHDTPESLQRHEDNRQRNIKLAKKLHAEGIGEYGRTRRSRFYRGGEPVYKITHRSERKVLKIERTHDVTEY